MSGDFAVPTIEVSSHVTAEEQELLKSGTRTPRPYSHDGVSIEQDVDRRDDRSRGVNGDILSEQPAAERRGSSTYAGRSGQASAAASDSGTEADDERAQFVKALPAPRVHPTKGLKTGESNADVLLTPSQLDDVGRRLTEEYFDQAQPRKVVSDDDKIAEEEKLLRIRLAEFARRSSEVAFMALVILSVLCGHGVLRSAYIWRRELACQVAIISTLVLAYPVKLSIVDSTSQAKRIWERFRVPASFDPATILYPTLLPVLVALSVSPANPATILPNILLGLATLPQRLFPRSSRLGDMNMLHWFVACIPLLVAENTAWPSKENPAVPYLLKSGPNGIAPETLVLLYPLHHTLLQPLQYLTTTSLLISELHLLSTSLINLLLLAESPQAVMLKACLWIGGGFLLFVCVPVLHWNVMLIRVPKWKFRRFDIQSRKRKSFLDALCDLFNLHRKASAVQPSNAENSDADEDEPATSIKFRPNGGPLLRVSSLTIPPVTGFGKSGETGPQSAILPSSANGTFPNLRARIRPRSNTLPELDVPSVPLQRPHNRRKDTSPSLLWYLDMTPVQAWRRKWIYAATTYLAIVAVILIPVRYYVLERALEGQEPIGWGLGYLFGQAIAIRSMIFRYGLEDWIAIPQEPASWSGTLLRFPLDIPALRYAFGSANTRLLLIAYWIPVLITGLLVVFTLTAKIEVDTRRKVFHAVMVVMVLPSTFIDPCACALALTLILAVFLLLEVIRAGQVSPLGNSIGRFIAPYVDGRDLRGPVVVSHLFLLIGCAVPLWFSLASISRTGDLPWRDWELLGETREVAMIAGVVCVGMGDAAASLVGRRYGRHKWIWIGGKSIEGSAAFAVAVTVGLVLSKLWLVLGGWNDNSSWREIHAGNMGTLHCVFAWQLTLAKAIFCACGASFMEAVLTGANDNVVVPVALWLLVKGVRL